MGHFSCVIQEAGSAEERRSELESRLLVHHARHYPGEQATVSWRAVPAGYMFTEGRQSTSSIVACVLGHDTTLAERERYMTGVCDIWTAVTGCTDHEVVVAITRVDPDQ